MRSILSPSMKSAMMSQVALLPTLLAWRVEAEEVVADTANQEALPQTATKGIVSEPLLGYGEAVAGEPIGAPSEEKQSPILKPLAPE